MLAQQQKEFLRRVTHAGPKSRYAVYQRTAYGMRQRALSLIFPMCLRIVGEDCFHAVADDYISKTPMLNDSLDEEGYGFEETWQAHVDARAELQGFGYLPDLVRLERMKHDAYINHKHAPFDWQRAGQCTQEQWMASRLLVCTTFQRMTSQWPLLSLFGQADTLGCIWVHRPDKVVCKGILEHHLDELMCAAIEGKTMAEIEHLGIEPTAFEEVVRRGWVVGLVNGWADET